MRILMLAQSFAPIVGGEERMVEDLSRELAERGHEVAIATLRQPESDGARDDLDLCVYELGSTSYRITRAHRDVERRHAPSVPDPETVLDLQRVLHRERPQIVHAHNWIVHSYLPLDRGRQALALSLHDYGLICSTKRLRRKDAICSGPGPLKCVACASRHYGPTKGVVAAVGCLSFQSTVRRHVDVFLPVSSTVERLCRIGPGELSRVIPNFTRELPQPPRDARLDELPDEPFILFFGDATVDKGAWQLAEAYRGLESPPPLVLIGRCYIGDLGDRPGVHVLGPWPHELVIEALRRSLFTVAPSIWPEPFGLVALEAASAGKAIVASDIGGLHDIVVDGETGLLVPADEREPLVAALRRLIADAELRDRLGRTARERAGEFSPEAIVPRYEEAYELALEARAARLGRRRPGGAAA
jgi:glycosyltransferase involved in cell wall biosynthesis